MELKDEILEYEFFEGAQLPPDLTPPDNIDEEEDDEQLEDQLQSEEDDFDEEIEYQSDDDWLKLSFSTSFSTVQCIVFKLAQHMLLRVFSFVGRQICIKYIIQ